MREPISQKELDLKLRQTYLGTSEWAVVSKLYNNYKTPLDVFDEKTFGYENIDNLRMRLGRDIEPMIAKWVEEEEDCIVSLDEYVRFDKEHDFLATNLDGVIHFKDGRPDAVLEIKTASQVAKESWGGNIPIQYYTQIQGQMHITGRKKAYVAVLTFGYAGVDSFDIYQYEYKPEFIKVVIGNLINFWNDHIITKIPPKAMTDSDVRRTYPEANGESIEASIGLINQFETLHQMKETKREIDISIKDIEIQIKKSIGHYESVRDGERTLATYSNSKPRVTFDRKSFQTENPKMYDKYLLEGSSYRTLRIKKESK
tara:strand:+ start:2745 stop:3686 length:942 start_codon:yes stop_codon:yes gene_type:complete